MRASLLYRLSSAAVMLLLAANGQEIIRSGEEIFVVAVKGDRGAMFRGSYLVTAGSGESKTVEIADTVPAEFKVVGTSIYLSFQKQSKDGGLEVEISMNGTAIKRQRTDAPYGVVTLASTMPASGLPRQTELRVEGSVKYAFLTLTSETGDTEQKLVEIPFRKEFFPRAGWIVGLVAQKTRVTRPDPLSSNGGIEVLDGGERGTVLVSIRVNGSVLKEAQASRPYGVARAAARIP